MPRLEDLDPLCRILNILQASVPGRLDFGLRTSSSDAEKGGFFVCLFFHFASLLVEAENIRCF